MPLGRDNNRRVIDSIPPPRKISRDPANVGGLEGRVIAGNASGPPPLSIEASKAITTRSSRWGNERMRSKTRDGGSMVKVTRRDLRTSENPWSGAREIADSLVYILWLFNSKRTT